MENYRKINLGCGNKIKKGYLNLDFIKTEGTDIVYDLNQYPWPFPENTFDEVYASHILEHLGDFPEGDGGNTENLQKWGENHNPGAPFQLRRQFPRPHPSAFFQLFYLRLFCKDGVRTAEI